MALSPTELLVPDHPATLAAELVTLRAENKRLRDRIMDLERECGVNPTTTPLKPRHNPLADRS